MLNVLSRISGPPEIAAGGDAFVRERIVLEQVEVEPAGRRRAATRIVEVGHVQVLVQRAAAAAIKEQVDVAERGERTQVILRHAAPVIDAAGIAVQPGAVTAIAGDDDVIAGAGRIVDRRRCRQRGEQQRPGRNADRRRIQRRDGDVGLQEAAIFGLQQIGQVGHLIDVEHGIGRRGAERGHAGRRIAEQPVAHALEIIRLEPERHLLVAGFGAIGAGRAGVHAVRGQDHHARIDQRAGAKAQAAAALIDEHLADAGDVVRIARSRRRTRRVNDDLRLIDRRSARHHAAGNPAEQRDADRSGPNRAGRDRSGVRCMDRFRRTVLRLRLHGERHHRREQRAPSHAAESRRSTLYHLTSPVLRTA
ncbi:hypothetical protein ACVOMT_17170 [Sphingomonas panni]